MTTKWSEIGIGCVKWREQRWTYAIDTFNDSRPVACHSVLTFCLIERTILRNCGLSFTEHKGTVY
jgi:hypothetical protein